MIDIILLGAGIGSRAKLSYPKQFMRLGGIPILIHVIKTIQKSMEMENIYLTIPEVYMNEYRTILGQYNCNNIVCIPGGETRQESVCIALGYCQNKKVLIHEIARPFISVKMIENIVNINRPVVAYGVNLIPTIYNELESNYPNRDKLWNIQLPQTLYTLT